MEICHLGFDVSTTGAGAVLLDNGGTIIGAWCWQDGGHVDERIFEIGAWAEDIFCGDVIFEHSQNANGVLSPSIEAPFFRGQSSGQLAMAQGAVICQHRSQWGHYAPQTVKATAKRCLNEHGESWEESPLLDGAKAATYAAAKYRWPETGVEDGPFRMVFDQPDMLKALGDLADAAWVAETDRLAVLASLEVPI